MKTLCKILICFCIIISENFEMQANAPQNENNFIDTLSYNSLQKCYDLYLQGVNSEAAKDTDKAEYYYDQYLSQNFKHEILNDIEIDILARYIGISNSRDDWEKVCDLGSRLIHLEQKTQEKYKNTAWMYLMYVYSLNMLNKSDNIEKIIDMGLHYVDITYKPTDKEYYELRFQHIIAKLNKDDYYSANQILNEIKKINDSIGQHVVDDEIYKTTQVLSKHTETDTLKEKKDFVEEFRHNVVSAGIWTGALSYNETIDLWHSIINSAQIFLNDSYFDINDAQEEDIWTNLIAWYGVLVNGFGRGLALPDRAEQAYNYVLTCKNFLDWHTNRIDKKEIKWEQIKRCVADEEIAIEMIPHSNEAIIISHQFDKPQIIEIDSLIYNRILEYDNNDPLAINNFYSPGNPLSDLINIIEPYLKGKKRLFISGSNRLAQFNWGAIPYKGKTLDDLYDIVPMLSTADIISYKSRKKNDLNVNSVILYGGMDYEKSAPSDNKNTNNESHWIYLSNVPDELRKGYNLLPHTQAEVDSIASLCNRYNINYQKFCGQDANELNIKKSHYQNSSILHIATHSFLLPSYSFKDLSRLSNENQTSRLGSGLSNTGLLFSGCNESLKGETAKSEDEILTAKEISQLDLANIELVVLSACSSGLGDLNNINGLTYGLSNAFRTAGVGQIMLSLWDIPDYTTSLLMYKFYESLLQGNNPRESLKLAQNYLISLGYKDPYYWAAFVIMD